MAKVYTSEYIEVFTHTGEGIALVPKLELTITTTGEPVHLMLQPQSVSSEATPIGYITAHKTYGYFGFKRNDLTFPSVTLNSDINNGQSAVISLPCCVLNYIDTPPPGTHTYRVYVKRANGNTPPYQAVAVYGAKLVAIALN